MKNGIRILHVTSFKGVPKLQAQNRLLSALELLLVLRQCLNAMFHNYRPCHKRHNSAYNLFIRLIKGQRKLLNRMYMNWHCFDLDLGKAQMESSKHYGGPM